MTVANAAFLELGDKLAKAENPETPIEILGQLILDRNNAVSKAAAENPSIPTEALLEAAMLGGLVDDYEPPLFAMAKHRNATPELLEQLALSDDSHVKRLVASNCNTTAATLTVLSKDFYDTVRAAVARNANTPVAVLESLCHRVDGTDWLVSSAVAENPNANRMCMLILLSKGHDEAVARRQDVDLSLLAPLARHKKVGIRNLVASHPRIDEKTLLMLARDGSATVRRSVAYNKNCPSDLFPTLARDRSEDVVHGLLQNPNCPLPIMEHFACDESECLRDAIRHNPSCPKSLAAILARWDDLHRAQQLPPRPPLP